MNNDSVTTFENEINQSFVDFKIRLDQQRIFSIQESLLKKIYEAAVDSVGSDAFGLIEQYGNFNDQLMAFGKKRDDLINEKIIIDAYSALEIFLADCYYNIFKNFPMFLGDVASVNVADLFFEDADVCKRNFIESKVKEMAQDNIQNMVLGFNRKFKVKVDIGQVLLDHAYEIALVRNLIIHNNGRVNRIYLNNIKRLKKVNYIMQDRTMISSEILADIALVVKEVSFNICDLVKTTVMSHSQRLFLYHESLVK
jgi:hypothetical protein